MIQDIAPHTFDNQYYDREVQEDSYVLLFCKKKLMVIETEQEDGTSTFRFPTYKELTKYGIEDAEMNYLFNLDGVDCFRLDFTAGKLLSLVTRTDSVLRSMVLAQKDLSIFFQTLWPGCHLAVPKYFRKAAPKEMAFAAITGVQIDQWYRKNQFCGECGKTLEHDKKLRMMKCPNCGNEIFPRINPAVIIGLTDDQDRMLLTKYNNSKIGYALVAGFNEVGETLEETVAREVMEETGLKVKDITYYKSQPWGFADDILMGFYCKLDGSDTIVVDHEELSTAEWYKREEIPVKPHDLSLTNEMICRFKDGEI